MVKPWGGPRDGNCRAAPSRHSSAPVRWAASPSVPGPGRARSPRALVERFDAVKFGIFQRKWSNSRELVLFCIEADFCNQILIFKHFSKSTIFAHLRTAPNSKSSQKFVKLLRIFVSNFCKNLYSWQFSSIFIEFCTDFDDFFSEFRRTF